MKRASFSQRIVANLIFREREPGEEAFDTVQWQMPNTLMRRFQVEARRRGTDVNALIRDVVCDALTERARAIRGDAAPADHRHE
jgi:hypothetical protein